MASNAIQKKSVELCLASVPKRANYLFGDPIRLEQILVNLVNNAIKFTEQGEVIVDVRIVDSHLSKDLIYLHFSVRDTGIGISPEKQESIFKPFTQADNSTTRIYGGTGLGLTISRRLVELMGGTLQLKSEPGIGSEFFFELIFKANTQANNLTSVLPYQNVLIADDSEVARNFLKSLVLSLGWHSSLVDSSEKVLQKIVQKRKNQFDLILLDWNLFGIDNIELIHKIRKLCTNKACMIIVMVRPFDRVTLVEHHVDELFDGIIGKPITSSSLYNTVLQAKEQHDRLENNNRTIEADERLVGLNLLVVDDSEINREVAYQILICEGAHVEVAENGAVALTLLKARPDYFHVVLMDVQMPVMDGYAATQAIREIPELNYLPIIALTAGAFKSQRIRALELGMDDFVAKPFEVNELVECILRLNNHRQNGKVRLDTPEIATPIPAIPFDELPLIDVEQGLKKWLSVPSYQKYLQLFLQDHVQDAEHIYDRFLNGDKVVAMEITHKLLGVAGALSLKRVAFYAAEIEASLSKNVDVEKLLMRFKSVFSQTLDAITAYLETETQPHIRQINSQNISSSVTTELEQLIDILNTNNPELIEPRLFALSEKLPKQQFDKIRNAVEVFDFQEAKIQATEILNGLNPPDEKE